MRTILLTLALAAASCSAAVLPTYTFTGSEADAPTVSGATFSSFTRLGVNQATVSGSFNSQGWENGGSLNASRYVQFTLTPATGNHMDLAQLSFDVTRGVNGPLNGEVAIFLGNPSAGADPFSAARVLQSFSPATGGSIAFNFADFSTVTDQGVAVRIYGWNAGGIGNAQNTMSVDNVALEVTPVPEPILMGLICFAGLALLISTYRVAKRPRRIP